MADRRLVFTVGTSLFSSASWRAEGRLALLPGYRAWTEEGFRDDPALRRTQGWRTVEAVKQEIVRAPDAFPELFAWEPEVPLRYPGELTTLLRLYQKEAEGGESVADFLRRRYAAIELVCPSGASDLAHVAAEQLARVVGEVVEHPAVVVQGVLASQHLADRARQFAAYLEQLPEHGVDLVLTGGYKGYALQAGLMAAARPPGSWRLIYLHEDHLSDLVVASVGERRELRQDFGNQRVVPTPRPVGE